MMISPFRHWKIRAKLISVMLLLVLLPLLCVAFLSISRFGKALRSSAEEDLGHLVRNIYSMCKVRQEMLENRLQEGLRVARYILYQEGKDVLLLPEEETHFDAVDQMTRMHYSVSVPHLMVGEKNLTRDTWLIDEVTRLMDVFCTVFQRIPGDRFLRVSTNVRERDGREAVGTFMPPGTPVVTAMLAGRPYTGRTHLFGAWYIVAYEPVTDRKGEVIGALGVGVMEPGAHSFKKEIKGIRVGDTGYVYVIDSKGTLVIHPAKEGENILNSKDSAGFEYIRAMISDALRLKPGEVGTIRYPWINPELGETKPRMKINRYIYFKPWDWIIAAGSYEEEIYRSLVGVERFTIAVVFVAVCLGLALTITLSKVLTRPVQALTRATTRMAQGDLSERVRIDTEDEIGVLGTSFNQMVSQIQDYTTNLEKMVEARTGELKNSREEYRSLSRFLNSILDSATEYAIMALDFRGYITEFNRGAENLFGWKKEEVLRKENISITILPEDQAKGIQKEMSKSARAEGVCEQEMERIRKNGERFPALTVVTAIRDPSGRVTGFVEIVRDITRRKTLERELKETKEFLENIMESSVDGIVTTNLKGKITYLNRAMEKMLDCQRKEVLGEHISRFYVRGIQQAREIMGVLRADERADNYELEVKSKAGDVLPIVTSIFLLRDEEEQVIGTAGIFKDVTEQKKLESRLKTAQANLVEASKMRALGELVAGVAHELNNPLMASQTILHVIFKNLHEGCPNRERLELIKKCNDRVEKIVEHLKGFSRQTSPEFQALDIQQPIDSALLITGQRLLDHNISIVKDFAKDLPQIWGDSNQLEQVFLNLISNAIDAMDMKGKEKELLIKTSLGTESGLPWVKASVRDSGIGIPRENLQKVFEPFFSTKPVGKGTGLGLSLCFGIMEAHGGRLEIDSEPGKGTEVKVILPAMKKPHSGIK